MPDDLFELCRRDASFKPLSGLRHVHLDLRYAGAGNVAHRDLYQGVTEAWLHKEAWDGLHAAALALAARRPGWKLRVYDAARPLGVQRELFALVQGTSKQAYVADPAHGSVHNYGMAVDLGLQDEKGWEADLGTGYDSFEDLAQPQLEEAFFQQGRLDASQIALRRLLRELMLAQGFQPHAMEWWHFERWPLSALKNRGLPMLGQPAVQT